MCTWMGIPNDDCGFLLCCGTKLDENRGFPGDCVRMFGPAMAGRKEITFGLWFTACIATGHCRRQSNAAAMTKWCWMNFQKFHWEKPPTPSKQSGHSINNDGMNLNSFFDCARWTACCIRVVLTDEEWMSRMRRASTCTFQSHRVKWHQINHASASLPN